MNLDHARQLAAAGRLYPAVILYGADDDARRAAALDLARRLLVPSAYAAGETATDDPAAGDPATSDPADANSLRRIAWPGEDARRFHPDLHVLLRDLRTVTSADATKAFLRPATSAPFEAPGQVFVVAEADSLSPEAADALLKLMEEPPTRTPRHFLLLTPSPRALLPTVRSRSLSIYLGAAEALDDDAVRARAEQVGEHVVRFAADGAVVHLLVAAAALGEGKAWSELRARRPWTQAAAVLTRVA
ncbi:MAG: hypothetical protein AAF772_20125, partial [Acidobacteriota bacterium]